MSEPETPAFIERHKAFVLVSLTFGLILLGIGAIWIWYEPAPRLVSVDLNGIVRDFVAETTTSDLSDEEKLARTRALASELEIVLQELAEKQNTIILTAPAVIAGAPDITEAVKQGMKK